MNREIAVDMQPLIMGVNRCKTSISCLLPSTSNTNPCVMCVQRQNPTLW